MTNHPQPIPFASTLEQVTPVGEIIKAAYDKILDADRIELEQYRAIFAALDGHVAQNGELHIVQNNRNGRRMIRVVNDATDSIETVHGVTVRDALAQAAQVVS